MLHSEGVGHAGDVVRHRPQLALLLPDVLELVGQLVGMGGVVLEQPQQHILRLALLTLGDGVAVHRVEHEHPQVGHSLGDLVALADDIRAVAGEDDVGGQGVNAVGISKAQRLLQPRRDVQRVDDAAPDGVVDVGVQIGDAVGKAEDLTLQRFGGVVPVWHRMPRRTS